MKILIWRYKHGTSYYDVSTKRKLSYALLRMVQSMIDVGYIMPVEKHDNQLIPRLRDEWNDDIHKVEEAKPVTEPYALKAAARLAYSVQGMEYCEWDIEKVENPLP